MRNLKKSDEKIEVRSLLPFPFQQPLGKKTHITPGKKPAVQKKRNLDQIERSE